MILTDNDNDNHDASTAKDPSIPLSHTIVWPGPCLPQANSSIYSWTFPLSSPSLSPDFTFTDLTETSSKNIRSGLYNHKSTSPRSCFQSLDVLHPVLSQRLCLRTPDDN